MFWCEDINCSKEGIPPVKQHLILTLKTTEVGHLLSHCSVQRGLHCLYSFSLAIVKTFISVRLFLCSKLKRWRGDSEGQSAAKDGLCEQLYYSVETCGWEYFYSVRHCSLSGIHSSWTSLCFVKTCSCTQFLLQLNFLLHSCWHTHRAQPIYALAKSTYKLHCSQAAPALMCASAILMKRWRRSTSIQALSRRILRIYLHYSTDAQNVSMLMLHF